MEKNIFNNEHFSGEIHVDKYDVILYGIMKEHPKDNLLYYMASSPPDYHISYSGSALPFQSKDQAFEGTPNVGKVLVDKNKKFMIKLVMPNSYMIGLGSVTIPPTVYMSFLAHCGATKFANVKVSEGVPYRSVTYPVSRNSAMFYNNVYSLPVLNNQEEVLRAGGYPSLNVMPENFWGQKPSL